MIRRLAVVALLALAGCGGGGGDSGGELRVEVAYPDPLRVGPVTWEILVVNGTDEAVELDFSNSQRGEVILSRDGEDVYQWSRGLMFTQELGSVEIPAGAERTFPLDEPGLDVDPGEYTLTASVRSTNRKLEVVRQVTVEPMRR